MIQESKSLVFTCLSWIPMFTCELVNSLWSALSAAPQAWGKPRTSLISQTQCIHLMEFYSTMIKTWAMIAQRHMEEIKIHMPNEIRQSLNYEPRIWMIYKNVMILECQILRTVRKQNNGCRDLWVGGRLCGEARWWGWGITRQGSYYDAMVFLTGHLLTHIKQGDANWNLQWCYPNSH